ncbi:MAG: NAD(P)H-hydrate dehydratase [Gemmatimonadales bacterium]
MGARVASAHETASCERATIERGTPSAELMRRAGEGAADLIASRWERAALRGVAVHAGSGNNGGDGWVVAGSLAQRGFSVRVVETGSPRTDEARNARATALESGLLRKGNPASTDGVVVDALLGTGATGMPRGDVAKAIEDVARAQENGAMVVALDLPSGLDATSGAHAGSVKADATVSFGNVKRGQLVAREVCGEIVAIDIGLDCGDQIESHPLLVDHDWVFRCVPAIPATAHKGTRKRLAIVGGGKGMAGAVILAGEGALRAGIGLLRIVVAPGNEVAIHAGIPAAIVHTWPSGVTELNTLVENVDAMAIGPGLGRSPQTRDLVERILLAWSGPTILDADALNVFAGDVESLGQLLSGRPAVITPHPAELARLLSIDTQQVVDNRFEIGGELARRIGAAVLLKGAPTVVFSPSGSRYVSATGSAALATGGSGDVLTGIAGTLVAQMNDGRDRAAEAATCAAFIHGRAAELLRFVRGIVLDDVLRVLPSAWNEEPQQLPDGVLAILPAAA